MGLHYNLPIYKATYDLLREVVKTSRNMPRDVKQAVGNVLRDECIGVSLMIYRANVSESKGAHIVELLERVQVIELFLRIALDERFISRGQYARMVELTQSIGRQVNVLNSSKPRTAISGYSGKPAKAIETEYVWHARCCGAGMR